MTADTGRSKTLVISERKTSRGILVEPAICISPNARGASLGFEGRGRDAYIPGEHSVWRRR